ncbi:hypothetical protein DSO57_1033461 [Entomophthora muscae]|uniref:Uncharacterized protein n=1 Tax=Entomophthora muscae TaxID=34485 RepID=A0ACC2SP24_9FUNG|nr:hypothetical protein DSO57_1033461 [Entomophthora muscae]
MLTPNPIPQQLSWKNVVYSCGFLFIPIVLSVAFELRISKALFISGLRCIIQLNLMGMVLNEVLGSNNPAYVIFLAIFLVFLASLEVAFSKTKQHFSFMLPFVFISLVVSSLIISVIGHLLVIRQSPFWAPVKFIPTTGMLIGNSMSAIAVGVNYCLKELSENATTLELHLSLGASRFEAFRPILIQALKLALLPTINSMSITGLIAIPGLKSKHSSTLTLKG